MRNLKVRSIAGVEGEGGSVAGQSWSFSNKELEGESERGFSTRPSI